MPGIEPWLIFMPGMLFWSMFIPGMEPWPVPLVLPLGIDIPGMGP
jgi:hypothetical protein